MTHLKRRRHYATYRMIAAASLALLSLSAWAQDAAPAAPPTAPAAKPVAKIDAGAKKLVQQMVAAHQALTSFSATLDAKATSGAREQNVKATIAYTKPTKVSVVTEMTEPGAKTVNHTTVADGKYVYTYDSGVPTQYGRTDFDAKALPLGEIIGAGGGSISGLVPAILVDPGFTEKIINPNSETVEFAPDETIGGVETRVVKTTATLRVPTTITFAIGKSDNLLRRVVLTAGPTVLTETYMDVKANPALAAETFTFIPPAGATMSDAPKQAGVTQDPPGYDPRLKVGSAPLPLSGTDTAGKVVSLAAYKGKVVLVDFWATWCGPCRAEIPNVVASYKKHHGQGFEVVGVSLDEPGDGAKIASYTKSSAMSWRQVHDKQKSITQSYGVQYIPFTMLIGRDGKIAALNVRGAELEKAIASAIKQK